MANKEIPHFVTSHDFHGDAEHVAWLQEKLHQVGAELQAVESQNPVM